MAESIPQGRRGQSAVTVTVASDAQLTPSRELRTTRAQKTPATLESLAFAAAAFEHAEGTSDTDNRDLHITGTQTQPSNDSFLHYPSQACGVHTERLEGHVSSGLTTNNSHPSAQIGPQQTLRISSPRPQPRSTVIPHKNRHVRVASCNTHTTYADQALSTQALEPYQDDGISSNEFVSL